MRVIAFVDLAAIFVAFASQKINNIESITAEGGQSQRERGSPILSERDYGES
jgi:hypothetical protein